MRQGMNAYELHDSYVHSEVGIVDVWYNEMNDFLRERSPKRGEWLDQTEVESEYESER